MNDRFLKACRGEATDKTPIWLMRQAGRYMKQYRDLRQKAGIMEIIADPALATEVTLQPVNAFEVDAAILFCDLLVVLPPMGVPFRFEKGEGPKIERPLLTAADVAAVHDFDPQQSLGHVMKAIAMLRRELDGRVPLIGFAGAPFTLASYMIEGGGSRNFDKAKTLMFTDRRTWHILMTKLVDNVATFLAAQIEAGVQAIQIFDSWVGCLAPEDYKEFVLPHSRELIRRVSGNVPVIHFGTGTATLLKLMQEAGGDVIGLDWKTPFAEGRALLGDKQAVQGNLDPILLLGDRDRMLQRAQAIIDANAGRPGHVFNLGHGILPSTDPENVKALVDAVHAAKAA